MKLVGTISLALAALLWIHTTTALHLPARSTTLSVALVGVTTIAWMWWRMFGRGPGPVLGENAGTAE